MRVEDVPYREIVVIDTEFESTAGERPIPVCICARELRSGRETRTWLYGAHRPNAPPFAAGPDVLVVAYFVSADFGCYLALGWELPPNVLDLFAEFRVLTNGVRLPHGNGLLGAAAYFRISTMSADDKHVLRALASRGSWTEGERAALLSYCAADVECVVKLLLAVLQQVSAGDLARAVLRGQYMKAVAAIEWNGVPLDTDMLTELTTRWEELRHGIISNVDAEIAVYDGTRFSIERFERLLVREGLRWPRTMTGLPKLDDDTLKDFGKTNEKIEDVRQIRHAMSDLRLHKLAVGLDGRNRTMLSPFRSSTGRNQPSNSRFIFGPAVWLRGLIRPAPGHALAYVDYEQQEFAIAAHLSDDDAMRKACTSEDPYIAFAIQAGAVPVGATRSTHPRERERFKTCVLGVLYGMGPETLARRLGIGHLEGRHLLDLCRRTFPKYWQWSANAVDTALLTREIHTVFGWRMHVGAGIGVPSLQNFPMQAHGAEILRLACIFAIAEGIEVCAPVHDALLIHAPLDAIDDAVAATRAAMNQAFAVVLGGTGARTDVRVVRWPDRYHDKRGARMWSLVCRLLGRREDGSRAPSTPT